MRLRKAREAFLIKRSQTLEPNGINKREEINLMCNPLFRYVLFHLIILSFISLF